MTTDYRARLFRERNPAADGILVDPSPPAMGYLADVEVDDVPTAGDRFAAALTTGAEAFDEGEAWLEAGDTDHARVRFEELSEQFGTVWIGQAARERLTAMDNPDKEVGDGNG